MKNPVRLVNRVNFEKELQEKKLECEDMIRKYLPKEEGFAAQLAEAMNYSMESGGKRLRPILMGETYRMFGGTSAIIEPFQAGKKDYPCGIWGSTGNLKRRCIIVVCI